MLADMDARGLAYRYCLGDLAGYATFPNEVIQIIREHEQAEGRRSPRLLCYHEGPGQRATGPVHQGAL